MKEEPSTPRPEESVFDALLDRATAVPADGQLVRAQVAAVATIAVLVASLAWIGSRAVHLERAGAKPGWDGSFCQLILRRK